jgi:hypothetical protein
MKLLERLREFYTGKTLKITECSMGEERIVNSWEGH